MKKLKILQFGPTAHRGGVAVAIADLCLGLANEGHEVGLLCNGGTVLDRLAGSEVKIFTRKSVGGTKVIMREVIPTAKILNKFNPDIIHAHGRGPSMVSTFAGRYPDVFTLHNSFFTKRTSFIDVGAIRRNFSPMGRNIIVLNEMAREYCRTELHVPNKRISTVLNGVDITRFCPAEPERREILRSALGVGKEQTLVLFVGRFHPQKQPQAVVKLAEALRARGKDCVRFVMIGDGEQREATAAMIVELGLDDRITMLEFQDPLAAYQAADLFVMPSLYEGFPIAMIEAMAAGCPVLRSRTGGFLEAIQDGETGYGCDVEIEDFIAKAVAILDDPKDRARVAAKARAKVVAEMSLSSHAQATVEVYHKALSERLRKQR